MGASPPHWVSASNQGIKRDRACMAMGTVEGGNETRKPAGGMRDWTNVASIENAENRPVPGYKANGA